MVEKIPLIYHHLEDMGGLIFQSLVDFLCVSQNLKVWTMQFIKLLGDIKNPRKCIANAIREMKFAHQVFRVTMESILIFFSQKLLGYDLVLSKICSCIKFCQIYVIMWSFVENMELCEVLPKYRIISSFAKNIELCLNFAKFMELCQVLPKIWNYVKFCEKYRIIWSFAKNIKLCVSFAKFMELCQVLPKIWNYVKFCQKYGIMWSFAKNIELYEVLPKI